MNDALAFGKKLLGGILKIYACFLALRITATGLGLGNDIVLPVGNVHTVITGCLLVAALAVLIVESRPRTEER